MLMIEHDAILNAPVSCGRFACGANPDFGDWCSRLAPPLTQQEEIYLQSLTEVAGSVLGFDAHQAGAPGVDQLLAFVRLALNPTAQVRATRQPHHHRLMRLCLTLAVVRAP